MRQILRANRLTAAVVAAMIIATGSGCYSRQTVPVSLEDAQAWHWFHGPSCRHYPFSCPRCPYYDGRRDVWHEPHWCGAEPITTSSPASGAPAASAKAETVQPPSPASEN